MKRFILIPVCFIAAQSFAQKPMLSLDTTKVKAYIKKYKERVGYDEKKGRGALFSARLRKPMFDTAQYSNTTPHGDVFILPQDNMACLKPESNSYVINMPNANNKARLFQQPKLIDQMPNGYKGRPFVLIKPKVTGPLIAPKK